MRSTRSSLFILFILFISFSIRGKEPSLNTRLFNDRDIISSEYTGFTMDKSGYLWIGTNYGLHRFDGSGFVSYLHDENDSTSLCDNRVRYLFTDSSRRLWVGTANGLNLYNPESDNFTYIKPGNLDFGGFIQAICQQPGGEIIFLVSGVGLYIIDDSSGTPEAVKYMPEVIHDAKILNSLIDDNGTLLAGKHNGSVIEIEPNGQTNEHKVSDTYIINLIKYKNGDILVISQEKAWRWDRKNNVFHPLAVEGDNKITFSTAHLGIDGTMYIGTTDNGLYRVSEDMIIPCRGYYNTTINMKKSRVSAIFEDPMDNLWIGIPYRGIVMVPKNPLPFHYYKMSAVAPGFSGGHVVVATGNDGMWVGLEKRGLVHINTDGTFDFTLDTPDIVNSVLRTSSDDIYVGIENHGVYKVNKSSRTLEPIYLKSKSYNIPSLCEDKDGNIYAAFYGIGVVIIDPKTGQIRWIENAEGSQEFKWLLSLFCDSSERLWISMYGALHCYDIKNGSLMDLGAVHYLANRGACYTIGEDASHNIWIGTSNGLIKLDHDLKNYRVFTTKDGLSDNTIMAMSPDSYGNMWFGSMSSLEKYDSSTGEFTSYIGGYGLEETRFSDASAYPGGKHLVFGVEHGTIGFSPETIKPIKFDHDVVITGVEINRSHITDVSLKDGRKVLNRDPNGNISRINMASNDNLLTLNLSTMDYRDARNVTYQWRMDNLGDMWINLKPGDDSFDIPHIRHGKHKLEIRAFENGIYSPVTTITIDVPSPWYLTITAKVIYTLIALAMAVLVIMVIKKKNVEKANDERIKFFINVSHEIRSPMTLILGPLERIMKIEHDSETAMMLNVMHRNVIRILGLVNQLLDLRKIDKGKMKILCSETELVDFVGEMVDLFKPKAKENNLSLTFEHDRAERPLNVWIDRNNFDKVLVNLITNAIKYTPSGGAITVSVDKGHDQDIKDYAEIRVCDTGIGLDEKNIDHIFDRFYQGKFNRSTTPLGFGIGLDLCQWMVKLHHGTITASNRKDTRGSCFTVRIPLGKKHLRPEQIEQENPETKENKVVQEHMNVTAMVDKSSASRKVRKNRSCTVMVVDDDADIREYIASVLNYNFRVIEAADGTEALKLLNDNPVDLIISDIIMPEMDGLSLLRRIKENISTNHIPVILLSSKGELADRMVGWDKGADGYIGKPFRIEELESLVDSLIDNRRRLKAKFSGKQEDAGKIEPPQIKGNDEQLMEKIKKIINDHIEDSSLNVEQLSAQIGVSRAHLHRKMKELLGMSPSEFIRNIRIQRACELLRNSDVDITQITYIIGFTSQPHFSTVFKRFTGLSPTEYRAQYSQDNNPAPNS